MLDAQRARKGIWNGVRIVLDIGGRAGMDGLGKDVDVDRKKCASERGATPVFTRSLEASKHQVNSLAPFFSFLFISF